MDVARRLFLEHGFHATGIAAIAKKSGVAVAQLYRDFESKDHLIAAIAEADCCKFADAQVLDRAIAAGDRSAVHAWLRKLMDGTGDLARDALYLEIIAEASRNAKIRSILADMQDDTESVLGRAVSWYVPDEGRSHQRRALLDAIKIVAGGMLHYRLVYREPVESEAVRLLMRAIDALIRDQTQQTAAV